MNNVIGVFDSTSIADQVISDLTSSGFSSSAVTRYEGGSDLESRLVSAGVEADEAREYAASVSQGGALVVAQAEDSQTDEAVAVMNRYYTGSDSDTAQYAAGDTQAVADTGEARLVVAEEQLMIGKREVSRGGVRVRSVVTEREAEAQVTLRDETIKVERRPVNRAPTDADTNVFSEQAFELTETDEEAVVAKETRVIEEVVIGKTVEQRTETVRDTVRRSDVEVEEIGSTYGASLAADPRYSGREWSQVESEAKTNWETTNQDKGTWEEVQGSVKGAWDRLRGKG